MLLLDKLQQLGFDLRTAVLYQYLLQNHEITESDLEDPNFIIKESATRIKKRLKDLERRGYVRIMKRSFDFVWFPVDSHEFFNALEKDIKKLEKHTRILTKCLTKHGVFKTLDFYSLTEKTKEVFWGLKETNNSVVKLAKKLKMRKKSVYYHVDKLKSAGLVKRRNGDKNKTNIRVLSTEEIIRELSDREKTIEELKSLLADEFYAGQDIVDLYGEGMPKIKTYVGVEQIKKLFDEMLAWDGEILNIGPGEGTQKFMPGWNEEFIPKFNKRGKDIRCIEFDDKLSERKKPVRFDIFPVFKILHLPKRFNVFQDTWIYNNKVIIISTTTQDGYKYSYATLTQHSSCFENAKINFETLWNLGQDDPSASCATRSPHHISNGLNNLHLNNILTSNKKN